MMMIVLNWRRHYPQVSNVGSKIGQLGSRVEDEFNTQVLTSANIAK